MFYDCVWSTLVSYAHLIPKLVVCIECRYDLQLGTDAISEQPKAVWARQFPHVDRTHQISHRQGIALWKNVVCYVLV